jgi:hypothetical protein
MDTNLRYGIRQSSYYEIPEAKEKVKLIEDFEETSTRLQNDGEDIARQPAHPSGSLSS